MRLVVAVVSAMLLSVGWPGVASAHTSVVESSTPADGTQVDRVEFIELRFTSAVKPAMATYALTVDGGTPVPLTAPVYTDDDTAVRFTLAEPLPHGQYRLAYQLVVADDNHPATGWIGFRVGPLTVRPSTPTATDPAPTPAAESSCDALPTLAWAAVVSILVVAGVAGGLIAHQRRRR